MSRFLRIFAILLILSGLAACGGSTTSSSGKQNANNLTFTDATHTTVTLIKPPTRIACLVGICEDILATLGINPVAVNDTLGQNAAFFGARAKSFQMIGGPFFDPNIEDIAKATPDMVIGLDNVHNNIRDALQPIAPLYIMNPTNYKDALFYLKDIGRLTGHNQVANTAAQRFMNKLDAYKTKSPMNKSLLLMYGSDVNFNIFTSASLPGSVLSQVTNYPWPAPGSGTSPANDHEPGAITYSLEQVLATNPDVIFIASLTFTPGAQPLSTQLKSNPVWSHLKAVQTNQVYEVNPSYYIFGRGTLSLGLALDDAMSKLYPTVFPQPLS